VGDVDSREHLITRALIKGLKTHAKALKTRNTVTLSPYCATLRP
jgi:hypothetical protein